MRARQLVRFFCVCLIGSFAGRGQAAAPVLANGSAAATQCYHATASSTDPERRAPSVLLTSQTAVRALEICRKAVADNPKDRTAVNGEIAAAIALKMPFDEVAMFSDEVRFARHAHIPPDSFYVDTFFQAGKYELATWDFDEGLNFLIYAAKTGHPASLNALYSAMKEDPLNSYRVHHLPASVWNDDIYCSSLQLGLKAAYDPESQAKVAQILREQFPSGCAGSRSASTSGGSTEAWVLVARSADGGDEYIDRNSVTGDATTRSFWAKIPGNKSGVAGASYVLLHEKILCGSKESVTLAIHVKDADGKDIQAGDDLPEQRSALNPGSFLGTVADKLCASLAK